MTGDIRYVSPITPTVCKEHSAPCQGKQLPVRLRVAVCTRFWCLSSGLRFLLVGLISLVAGAVTGTFNRKLIFAI